MASTDKDAIRQAAEDDLYSFIRLVAPLTANRDILKESEMNDIINSFKFEKK